MELVEKKNYAQIKQTHLLDCIIAIDNHYTDGTENRHDSQSDMMVIHLDNVGM